ncbi:MAG: formylglycine-generating enzyme family protein, partial [Limisphaerales bacterium]
MIPDSIAGSLKLALLGLLTWACSETGLAQRPLELKVDFFDLRPLGSSMRFFITPGFKELMDEASSVPVLRIEGPDHYPWHIEASSNLLDPGLWRSLGEVRTGPKPILLMDLQGQGANGVFYRARPLMINPEPDRLVLIPAGTFLMGSPFDEQDRDTDENPMTRVTLSRDYWMGKYEITQG